MNKSRLVAMNKSKLAILESNLTGLQQQLKKTSKPRKESPEGKPFRKEKEEFRFVELEEDEGGHMDAFEVEYESEDHSDYLALDSIEVDGSKDFFMNYHQRESGVAEGKPVDLEAQLIDKQLLERDSFDGEYKMKFSDFLPLTFFSVNNRLESKALMHDLSLSNFSIEDVQIGDILGKRKAEEQECNEEEAVDTTGLSLMSQVCIVQRNFREISSNLLKKNAAIVKPLEQFSWFRNKKYLKYQEMNEMSLEERLAFEDDRMQFEQTIKKNQLADVAKYYSNYETPFYKRPVYLSGDEHADKPCFNTIPISEHYFTNMHLTLRDEQAPLLEKKRKDKRAFLHYLEKLDSHFLQLLQSMEYENRLMQEDNLNITDKNKVLFTCLKNMNKEISNEEKSKLENQEKMGKNMKLKNKLLHDNREDLRKNILDRRADELEVDFKEINRKEVLERKNMQEKKKLNKELSKVMNKMNLTFIASNNKLRGIARGGESRNSLQDIMSYKLESEGRRGRSISNQKLLFKNKTGLSDITMAKIKLEEFNDVVDMERMEDRLRFSRGWVHANSEALLDNKVRIGYSVESLQRERPNPIRMVDDVARIQMKELLRSTLIVPPEEESKEQQQVCPEGCEGDIEGDGRSGSELQSVKGLKRVVRSPPRLLKRIEDNDNYIVKKSIDEYRHWDKVRKGPRHSRSKEDIKRTGKGLVEAHIVNKPNNYREARLRQALLGNKTLK